MSLLVYPSDCVAVGHFEEREVLDLSVEAILKLVYWFFEVLVFQQEVVLDVELVFDTELGLNDLGQELGVTVFVNFVAGDGFTAQEVE